MPTTLTPRSIARLKPAATAYYVTDAVRRGLQLRVAPDNSRVWSLRYRLGRQQRRLGLGAADVVSLANARTAAKDALKLVARGIDPAQQKRDARDADTIATLAALYLEKHARPKKRSWKGDQRILDTIVLPAWARRPANAVTRRDVRELIESVNGKVYPNRVRALLLTMFNFAIEREILETNPAAATKKPAKERSRDRVLTESELRAFWAATGTMEPVMRAVFRLRLLTAQRGGEVINMRWQDLDLSSAMWTIPSEFSKNRLPHRLPLNAPALDILKDLRSALDARLAASTSKHPKQPIFVLRGARGNRQRGEAAHDVTIENFKAHDLRRTAATVMASSGVSETVISKILNHSDSGVTKVYVRAGYDAEKETRVGFMGPAALGDRRTEGPGRDRGSVRAELIVVIDLAALPAWVHFYNRTETFEPFAADLEAFCRQDPSRKFAGELLHTLADARRWLRAGHTDLAMAAAMRAGILAAGSGFLLGQQLRRARHEGGVGRGKQLSAGARKQKRQIAQLLHRYKTAGAPVPSKRAIARELGISERTVARHLPK